MPTASVSQPFVPPYSKKLSNMKVEVREKSCSGKGVYVLERISRDTRILKFQGEIKKRSELSDFTHVIEVGNSLFLGPSELEDDYVNHCCDPNCRVAFHDGEFFLESVRDIEVEEELSFDYSTVMVEDPTDFMCNCGAAQCRGRISAVTQLPPALQKSMKERGLIPPFVIDHLESVAES